MIFLQDVVGQIVTGATVPKAHVETLLAPGARSERFAVCRALSLAYAQASDTGRAATFGHRALALWVGEEGFIDEYVSLMREQKNAEAIKAASKLAGMWFAERGALMSAILHFNAHHYAEQSTGYGDKYVYDHDILKAVERLAGVGPNGKLPRRKLSSGSRVKVAYLVFGANHTVSALISILLEFARYHDKSRFELLFFSPDSNVATRQANEKLMRSAGAELIAIDSLDDEACLLQVEQLLRQSEPDLIVSIAGLADYRQYYLFAGCPAAARISLCYGPPAQFIPPKADWVISSTRHTLMDSPCDGSLVEIEVTLPVRPSLSPPLPEGIVLPEDAVVVVAGGRSEKFLDRHYWEAIFTALRANPKAYFIAFGLIARPAFLAELLNSDVGNRVFVLGWLVDYYPLLSRADIFVDTFPSGGGLTVMDSMAYGVPVLSFSNNYLISFNQADWNPAEEILGSSELLVPRGDYEEFANRLGRLIASEALRTSLGARCMDYVFKTRANPWKMVARIESEYSRVLARI